MDNHGRMAGMELREVEAFLALAEELHFGRAADRLGLSQSRVSQLIRRLETRVGGAVFDRTSRRVSLTPLGATLVEELAQPYAGLRQALERARGTARDIRGALRVGFYSTVIGEMLSEPVRRFRSRHPEVDVNLIGTSFGDLTGPLLRGEVDVLATWLPWPEPGLTTGATLAVSGGVLIVGAAPPLAGGPVATIEDIADYGAYELEPPFPQPLRELVLPAAAPSGRPIDREPVDRLTHVL